MIEKFEYKGLWFLPSNIEKKVHGILKYDYENNINVLELLGSFYDNTSCEIEDIILGITTYGDEITLTECYFSSSTGIPNDRIDGFFKSKEDKLSTLNFRITTILKGQHIFKQEDLVFQKVYTEIFNLDEWLGITGLEVENSYENSTKTIHYKKPKPIKIQINENFDMEINFFSNHPIRTRFANELILKQLTVLSFHSKQYTTLREFIYLLHKFNNFLSTSLQKPVRIQSMELYCDKFNEVIHDEIVSEKTIDGYQIINPELKFEEKKHDWEMLFTYNDIKKDFEAIIQKWFYNHELYDSPFNLVLSQYYISQYFLENLFINVAQAAESFHRRLKIIEDIPKKNQDDEFDDKVNRIIESAPDDLKKWVESRISKPKHFYDTRLKYILENFSNPELNKMIGKHPAFIKDVVCSRNYYTHYNSQQEKDAAKGYQLIQLYKRLRLLLICGFLIESGFEKTLLERLLKEKSYNMFSDLMN